MNRLLTIVDTKYQRLEYLESTRTQFLKIPIELNLNDTVIADVAILDTGSGSGDTCFFEIGSNTTRKGLWGYRGNAYYNLYYSYGGGSTGTGYTILDHILNQRTKIKTILENSQYKIYVNDTAVVSVEGKTNVVSQNLGVFAQYSGGYKSKIKLYGLQAIDYQTGVKKLNLVPVYDTETQKYGMWESVERKFYGNEGTGDFTGA